MKVDWYTRIMLGIIALCLVVLASEKLGIQFYSAAQATQGKAKTIPCFVEAKHIKGVSIMPEMVQSNPILNNHKVIQTECIPYVLGYASSKPPLAR